MSEVVLDVGDVDRLDVHFALGSELLIVNSGGSDAVCHSVDWASTSSLTRHATLLAVSGPNTIHCAPPIGLVDESHQNIGVSAQAISDALNTVTDAEMWIGNDEGMLELADVHLEGAQNSAAVWDLIATLMFLQQDPSGFISEELVQWAIKHSESLSSGLSSSLYEYVSPRVARAVDCGTSLMRALSVQAVSCTARFCSRWRLFRAPWSHGSELLDTASTAAGHRGFRARVAAAQCTD